MKTLIEDLKKVITSNIEDKDKYCEKLINGFLRERETEQLLIHGVVKSSPKDNFCQVCNLPTDGVKCYSKRCPV